MSQLPPGQRERDDFPRFGMPAAAAYDPGNHPQSITVGGEVEENFQVALSELTGLSRVQQVSDFHCVTTWSVRQMRWSGYRFSEFWEELLLPRLPPGAPPRRLVFKGDDGYWSSLPLSDALAPDVILADTLNEGPLPLEHGAPLRLLATGHYGYKSVKHLSGIDFRTTFKGGPGILEHPRARVEFEERAKGIPGRILRLPYSLFVDPIVKKLNPPGGR